MSEIVDQIESTKQEAIPEQSVAVIERRGTSATLLLHANISFSPETLQSVYQSTETLSELLPRVEVGVNDVGNRFMVRFAPQDGDPFIKAPSAVRIECGNNLLVANVTSFDQFPHAWAMLSSGVLAMLRGLLSSPQAGEVLFNGIELQVMDRVFSKTSPESFDVRNVMREDSEFFSPKLLTSGYDWYLNHGWVDQAKEIDAKILNRLNINNVALGSDQSFVTQFDHHQFLRYENKQILPAALLLENGGLPYLDGYISILHAKNDAVTSSLIPEHLRRNDLKTI